MSSDGDIRIGSFLRVVELLQELAGGFRVSGIGLPASVMHLHDQARRTLPNERRRHKLIHRLFEPVSGRKVSGGEYHTHGRDIAISLSLDAAVVTVFPSEEGFDQGKTPPSTRAAGEDEHLLRGDEFRHVDSAVRAVEEDSHLAAGVFLGVLGEAGCEATLWTDVEDELRVFRFVEVGFRGKGAGGEWVRRPGVEA